MGFAAKCAGGLVVALLLLMVVSFFLLRNGTATTAGQEPGVAKGVFIVVNAATLSGFELASSTEQYKPVGQWLIFGLIVLGSLISLLLGGLALRRILALPFSDGTILRSTIFLYLICVMIGATVLIDDNRSLGASLFQAASAFGNAGQYIGRLPDVADWRTHVVLLPLSMIGGLGIVVVLDLLMSLNRRHVMHSQTKNVLAWTAVIYLFGTAAICVLQMGNESTPRDALIVASTATLNSRTLGMPLGEFSQLAIGSQWVVMAIMFIGGSTGGTAGGLKTTTLHVLLRDSGRLMNGDMASNRFGLAIGWTLTFAVMIALGTRAMMFSEPSISSMRVLFLTISAISNTGLSHTTVSVSESGFYMLSALMLFGRIGPLVILASVARNCIADGTSEA